MFANVVRDSLSQVQQRLVRWLVAQAAMLDLTVEELAERYTLEVGPVEAAYDEAQGIFRAEQGYRLRRRTEGPPA